MEHFQGELLGTMVLVLLGDGVVAGVLLARTKGHNAGWLAITAGWAFAVLCGIHTAKAFGAPGYVNPVGPLIELTKESIDTVTMFQLIGAQFAGAFIGAVLVWIHYLPHWRETPEPELKLAVFCTAPAIRNPAANLLSEIIGTFVLVFVAGSIGRANLFSMEPAIVGALVWAIGLSLGSTTGYAINPARDLGPRIAHFVLPISGKGGSDWGYAWIPVLGPVIGALAATALTKALSSS